jgi:hypothetical protein
VPVEHGRIIAHGYGLPGFFIEGGYSGAPIFDGQSAVLLGMAALAVREKDKRTAFIVPVQALERAWPPLAKPYQGLAAFRECDARFFKGRDRYVRELAEKLDKLPLIAAAVAVANSTNKGNHAVGDACRPPSCCRPLSWLNLPCAQKAAIGFGKRTLGDWSRTNAASTGCW